MALTVHELVPLRPARTPLSLTRGLFMAMRPQQWTKNLIVFAAPAFALKFDVRTLTLAALAFIAFCAMSAAAYLVNDMLDIRRDRLHPAKKYRPIASGVVPIPLAAGVAMNLILASLVLGLLIAPGLLIALVTYAVLQAAYNFRLKQEPIIDVLSVSAGFVTRALGGAAAVSVEVSTWFLLCVALLALFLAIGKRTAELRSLGDSTATRQVLKAYSLPLLTRMESVVTASALMSYSLWAAQRTPKHWMLATVPIVAYVMFRYQMLTEKGAGEEPDVVLIKSPAIVIATILWIASCMAILLFQGHGAPWHVCSEYC